MKYNVYLELKLYPDHVLARLLTETDAKSLHYKDGFRSDSETNSTLVVGFETADKARSFITAMKNCFLIT